VWLLRTLCLEASLSLFLQMMAIKLVAASLTALVFGAISFVLRHRGLLVCFASCLYISTLVAISLSMHQLFKPPLNYHFPAFVTLAHYLTTWAATAIYWLAVGRPDNCFPSSAGSARHYAERFIPIALTLPVSITLNNSALYFIGAGLCSIVGSFSPIFTAFVSNCCGRKLNCTSWLGVTIACSGALLLAAGEARILNAAKISQSAVATTIGLSLSMGAVALRSVRIVLQDKVIAPLAYSRGQLPGTRTEERFSPMHLLVVQSPPVVLAALFFALLTENASLAYEQLTVGAATAVAGTCIVATVLNITGAYLLEKLGSTAMQIVGKLNIIVTVSVSMAFFDERLPPAVLSASAVILVGSAIFEQGQRSSESVLHHMKRCEV